MDKKEHESLLVMSAALRDAILTAPISLITLPQFGDMLDRREAELEELNKQFPNEELYVYHKETIRLGRERIAAFVKAKGH